LVKQHSFRRSRYVSNPIPGIKKNGLLLTTGVRLAFGKVVKTAMQYQHPELEIVRAALNQTGSATEPGA
jgi:hypothetical protein